MNPSGGLPYHWRAYRYGKTLWKQHLDAVESFLDAWNPTSKTLVIIGPSAGYSLPPSFLDRFERVIGVEPELFARFAFEKRLKIRVEWIRRPMRFEPKIQWNVKEGDVLLPEGAAVLFANVLGQIIIKNVPQLKRNLHTFLEEREWASYHDALSGESLEFDTENAAHEKATLAEMKSWIFLKNRRLETLELTAHLAPDLFVGSAKLTYRYWQWQLTRTKTHLIEGVFQKNS